MFRIGSLQQTSAYLEAIFHCVSIEKYSINVSFFIKSDILVHHEICLEQVRLDEESRYRVDKTLPTQLLE